MAGPAEQESETHANIFHSPFPQGAGVRLIMDGAGRSRLPGVSELSSERKPKTELELALRADERSASDRSRRSRRSPMAETGTCGWRLGGEESNKENKEEESRTEPDSTPRGTEAGRAGSDNGRTSALGPVVAQCIKQEGFRRCLLHHIPRTGFSTISTFAPLHTDTGGK